jgi:succinate dehydrogenase/fumarate reductase flavoprotein subunit
MAPETDVLVIGFGPAGAAAAITAGDAGAEVLVVEKTGRGGGNAPYSGGFLWDVAEPDALTHLEALCGGQTDRAVLEAYAAGLHEVRDWVRALGGETVEFVPPTDVEYPRFLPAWPYLPGAGAVSYHLLAGAPPPSGAALWDLIAAGVSARGIAVAHDTAATRLLTGDDGAVTGAVVRGADGTERAITARGGVVLACGGLEGDPALRAAYLPVAPLVALGHDGNTGDGVRMAQQAGAALWHMSAFFGWFVFRAPEFAAGFPLDFHDTSFLWVDATGRRFTDEAGWEAHDRVRAVTTFSPRRGNHAAFPLYAIFDGRTRQAGPLNGVVGTPNAYAWSVDNTAEVERGWIARADGAGPLAGALGLEPATLTATIEAYNTGAAAGRDADFDRAPGTMAPLDTTDLYAIEMWPGIATASGGPRRDARARVVREDGTPIDGLYAAGACGSIWGMLTQHGGGLTDAIVFGRIAGADAVRRSEVVSEAEGVL